MQQQSKTTHLKSELVLLSKLCLPENGWYVALNPGPFILPSDLNSRIRVSSDTTTTCSLVPQYFPIRSRSDMLPLYICNKSLMPKINRPQNVGTCHI